MAQLKPVRFEDGRPVLLAGLREWYNTATMGDIPSLWKRLAPHLGKIPGQVDHVTYGVVPNMAGSDGGFDYMAGVKGSRADALPLGFVSTSIPPHRYAVFAHEGHVSTLKDTIGASGMTGFLLSAIRPARHRGCWSAMESISIR